MGGTNSIGKYLRSAGHGGGKYI